MNGTNGRILLLLLSCCFLACSEKAAEDSSRESTPLSERTVLKGHAVHGHEVRTIRPCGEEEVVWAIDSTQLLWELHDELAPGMEPYEEVFVVVQGIAGEAMEEGFGADYSGSFYVDRVLYVAAEGWGCDLDLTGFQFRVSGNEPFWTLVITESTAELSRMDASRRTWSDVRSETTAGGFRYLVEDGEPNSLLVSLSENPCRDTMSGAYHGYSASVTVAGEELTGCALRGTSQ